MPREQLLRAAVIGACGASVFVSCSVDSRHLVAGTGYAGFWVIAGSSDDGGGGGVEADGNDSGEHPGGGDQTQAGTSAGGSGGHQAGTSNPPGGNAGNVPVLPDGCPDLNRNGIGDCKETLVDNPSFATNTAGWVPEDTTLFVEWSPENHFNDSPSGSAQLTAKVFTDPPTLILQAATQCVASSAKQMQVFASTFVPAGQGEGGAAINVLFYPTDDCSGPLIGSPLNVSSSIVDAWQTIGTTQLVPEGSNSARVRLAVTKYSNEPSHEVLFDNILVRAE